MMLDLRKLSFGGPAAIIVSRALGAWIPSLMISP